LIIFRKSVDEMQVPIKYNKNMITLPADRIHL